MQQRLTNLKQSKIITMLPRCNNAFSRFNWISTVPQHWHTMFGHSFFIKTSTAGKSYGSTFQVSMGNNFKFQDLCPAYT